MNVYEYCNGRLSRINTKVYNLIAENQRLTREREEVELSRSNNIGYKLKLINDKIHNNSIEISRLHSMRVEVAKIIEILNNER